MHSERIEPGTPDLSNQHSLGDDPIPEIVQTIADGRPVAMIWRNELGGLTFAIADTYVKWNPFNTEIDLTRERDRMVWLAERHASPRVIDFGFDDQAQWLVSEAMPGEHAVGDRWADLAIASLSLDWNFGEGNQDEFFDAYGVARDDDRIRYYRGLWHLES